MAVTEEAAGGEALLLFARHPFAGEVKTRLAAGIGAANARRLYSCFLKDTAAQLRRLNCGVFVFFTPASAGREFRDFLGADLACLPQEGDTLGERMKNAFRAVFDRGISRAVAIGSDLPGLNAGHLREAFARLRESPAVIGPAPDGGYYLLGLRAEVFPGEVFDDITWSTGVVFAETMARFRKMNVSPAVLGSLSDIDDLADLKRFYGDKERGRTAPATMEFISRALGGLAPYETFQN